MEKGVWSRWQVILGAVLTIVCLSCQPRMAPMPRPAPPPPPAAVPQPPARETLFVKVARLNLRAGPGMDFPKLGLLERNEELEKVGEAENWYQVRVKRDNSLGWVSSEYLSTTPVTSPIETPVPEAPPAPAETKQPKPTKVDTSIPRAPKPAEAAEPPAPKAKPVAEPAQPPEPKAVPERPAPKQVEPPPPPPPPPPPEEKPGGIRIM
jgi:hypothetical protein